MTMASPATSRPRPAFLVYLDGDLYDIGLSALQRVAFIWWVRAREAAGETGARA